MKKIKSAVQWAKVVQSAETIRIRELELDIKKLKQQVAKQEKIIAEQKKSIKLQRKKIATFKAKNKRLKVRIKRLGKTKAAKITNARRSKEQYMAEQHTTWVNRFINRLIEDQVEFTEDLERGLTVQVKISNIRNKLLSLAPGELYDEMLMYNLTSAYYDSDGVRAFIGIDGDAFYEDIMSR